MIKRQIIRLHVLILVTWSVKQL